MAAVMRRVRSTVAQAGPMLGAMALVAAVLTLPTAATAMPAAAPEFDGDPVTGGTNVQEATLIEPGRYVSKVPEAKGIEYFEVKRSIPKSTIWYGGSVIGSAEKPGSVSISGLADGDGSLDCDEGFGLMSRYNDVAPYETGLWSTDTNPKCGTADSIVIKVSAGDYNGDPPSGDPYQLVVWEEPPATNADELPAPSSSVTWQEMKESGDPKKLTPGGSYVDAPVLKDGSYTTHVDPGQVALFQVPLVYGQHAQVMARTDTTSTEFSTDGVKGSWVTPLGGRTETELSGADAPEDSLALDDDDTDKPAGWSSPVVSWRNREATLEDNVVPAAFPGTYLLQIDVPSKDMPEDGVDLTFDVETFSDFEGGEPTYDSKADDLPQIVAAANTSGGEEQPRGGGEAAAGDSDETPWPQVTMLFGGAAVFMAAGVVALGRARKARP